MNSGQLPKVDTWIWTERGSSRRTGEAKGSPVTETKKAARRRAAFKKRNSEFRPMPLLYAVESRDPTPAEPNRAKPWMPAPAQNSGEELRRLRCPPHRLSRLRF